MENRIMITAAVRNQKMSIINKQLENQDKNKRERAALSSNVHPIHSITLETRCTARSIFLRLLSTCALEAVVCAFLAKDMASSASSSAVCTAKSLARPSSSAMLWCDDK